MIVGNDVSQFQGDINWDTYKNNSNFVIIRASYGNGYIDGKFTKNQNAVRSAGLAHGYYHYCYPQYNNPEAEAQWFLNVIGNLQDGEVLCLDDEEALVGVDRATWCNNFLNYVYTKTNCKPLIYLNQSLVSTNNWQKVVDGGYGLWIASYTYDPNKNTYEKGAWKFAAMQQWTNQQQVPGISGNVDGDVFFGGITDFKLYGYHAPIVPPPVQPIPTPPIPIPPTPPAQPVPEPTPPSSNPCCDLLTQARSVIFGKGFWWTKYFKLKELLK